ncbi:MAG TPA: 3-hydroxybutyryl-CoA dehydrogenase [Stellaceae bacterium]|nr:3-hydroxybutyryl-CoA dehydrogenase [Stellaceae bacterium]
MTDKTLGVIGAGIMGSGIAQTAAAGGFDVVMVDVSDAAVQRGLSGIDGRLDRMVKKGTLDAAAKSAAMARIRPSTDYADLAGCGLVIEAATENYEIKVKILKQLDAVINETAFVASNTSSISITHLAAALKRPERFSGMHFFNPVPIMSLVELIRGLQTSDETHAAFDAAARQFGKTPISVKNSPGFAVNRLLVPMLNEAFFVLAEGLATPEEIDEGMKLGCSHPIGPLALADLIGLDTLLAVIEVLHADFGDPKYRPAPLLREYVGAGYLGRKSGRGVYQY